jgi:hypothetical protein
MSADARRAADEAFRDTDSPDTSPGVTDAGGLDAAYAADFANRVRVAVAQGGTPSTCASPLPATAVTGRDEARAAVAAFIAEVVMPDASALSVVAGECGTPSTQTCARRFQHDVYKSNGIYGEMLYPLAEELESRASFVEETIWTITDGSSNGASVCISGVVDGILVGIVMFNDRQSCP